MRLLLPLPPIRAALEIQEWTHKRTISYSLGGLELLPLYTLEQTKFATLHHIQGFGDKQLVQRSRDAAGKLTLQRCLATPHGPKGTGHLWHLWRSNKTAVSCRSHAYVVDRDFFDGYPIVKRTFGNALHHKGNAWVEVTAANVFAILRALADGHGKLVIRFWWVFLTPWELHEWNL
ncbi:hypothetical protein LTR36_006780 [Oleoguttula mirabilis]|uniref:Uncharacterized protein n=1 Tax=Oleoguttula mirabilis TaxID=1507867 RepID=A0AAV9JBN0_9PEZI|nr:hypothetical protein LTR36_006780 [Oleoguttula mirabilis]